MERDEQDAGAEPITPTGAPAQLRVLRDQLGVASPSALRSLRVRLERVSGDPARTTHLRGCTAAGPGQVRPVLVRLGRIEDAPWCEVCSAGSEQAQVVGAEPYRDLRSHCDRLVALVGAAQATEARFARTASSNLSKRALLIAEHERTLEQAGMMLSGRWTWSPPGLEVVSTEVETYIAELLRARRGEAVPVSKRLHNGLAKASAAAQGLSEHQGVLEEDEVLIGLAYTPASGFAAQIVSAYGLERSGRGAVVLGPRFLVPLLVEDEGVFPQITPAPARAVAEIAAGLWEPGSAGLSALAHAVRAARDVLAA